MELRKRLGFKGHEIIPIFFLLSLSPSKSATLPLNLYLRRTNKPGSDELRMRKNEDIHGDGGTRNLGESKRS
ncbi:hypothetical protein RRG08_039583 [Elysia crispata]|uniref:Uncharacterized protein n=1 Tax=Elysia crispata TaxID=231223 RepID=A0AAE1E670_9GAST|nr:hypothetical protein RRG08_039583 [Elysia crispata]